MEEETINRIILAIQTQLNPAATSAQRQEAQQYCEEFKNNARSAYFAFHLLHIKYDAPIRHFGLLLLETRIKTDWQIFSEQQRDGIRKSILNFIAGGTNDVLEEQQYIKEKSAALVVEIAKRDWPQKWRTLVPNLFEIARAGEKQMELVLLVFKNLVLEVKEYNDDLPTSRRKDLSNALLHEADGIFHFFYQALEMSYGKYKTAKEQNSPTLKKDITLVTAALTAIHAYFDLTPIDQILKYNLHAVFCLVLGDIPFRMVACEGILTLISRKEKEKSDSVKLLFPFQSIEGIEASLKQSTSGDLAVDYNYIKSLSKVLIQLGLNHLSIFNPQQLPPNYQQFLDLMLEITAHPSLVITYETIAFWQRLLDNSYFKQNIDMKGLCFRLLEALDEKIPKWNRSSEEASKNFAKWRGAFFWKIDFEYNDEFMHFFSQARSKFSTFITLIATIVPEVALEFVGKKFAALSASITKANPQHLQKTSLEVVYFEACDTQISSIMNGVSPSLLDPSNPEAERTIALTEGLLKLIFDFSSTEPLLVEHQIAALKYFKKYYQAHQTSLEVVLTKLLSLVLFKRPDEPTLETLSKSTLEARRKAATTFIYLCDTMPDKLVQHVPKLIVAVKEMFGQLLDSEKIYLIEALASVSNGMKSFAAQEQYLTQLLANVEEEWLAPAVQECFATIDQLLTTLNVHPQASAAQREQNAPISKAKRGAIYRLINTFYYIWKRVTTPSTPEELVQGGYLDASAAMQIVSSFQEDPSVKKKKIDENEMRTRLKQRLHRAARHPLSAHTRRIAPSILVLTRSLHALWSPPVRQALPTDAAAIFQIDPARASALLNPSQEQPKQTPNRENDMAMMRHWLESMREVCYSLLGKFIGEQQGTVVHDLSLPQSLLFNFEHIENRHLSIFIRRILKKIMVLPPESNQELVNFLAQCCLFIFDRLMKSWTAKLAAAAQPYAPNNEETITAEVINEALLHNLSREFSAFMKEMLFHMSHSWTGSTHVDMGNTPAPSAIFNYLLQHNMAKPILSGVIECLKFPDSTIFANAFAVCCALLPVLFGQPEQLLQGVPMQFDQERLINYAKLVGQDLVTNLLAVLWTPIGQERHAQILGAIGLIFLFLRAVSQATGSEQYLNLMFQIFTKLPNANDLAVINLRDMLYKSKPNTVRNVLRTFLGDVCNLKLGGESKKASNIVEHHEKVLNSNKQLAKARQQQAENDSFAAMLEALYTDDR